MKANRLICVASVILALSTAALGNERSEAAAKLGSAINEYVCHDKVAVIGKAFEARESGMSAKEYVEKLPSKKMDRSYENQLAQSMAADIYRRT